MNEVAGINIPVTVQIENQVSNSAQYSCSPPEITHLASDFDTGGGSFLMNLFLHP